MARVRAALPVIWATLSVLVTICLLLAIVEIEHLSSRVDSLSGQIAANRDQIKAMTGVIADRDQQIISLGGTPHPTAAPGVTPAPTRTRTVVRVVPGPTRTVTPAPSSSSRPRVLPTLIPTPPPTAHGKSTKLICFSAPCK